MHWITCSKWNLRKKKNSQVANFDVTFIEMKNIPPFFSKQDNKNSISNVFFSWRGEKAEKNIRFIVVKSLHLYLNGTAFCIQLKKTICFLGALKLETLKKSQKTCLYYLLIKYGLIKANMLNDTLKWETVAESLNNHNKLRRIFKFI